MNKQDDTVAINGLIVTTIKNLRYLSFHKLAMAGIVFVINNDRKTGYFSKNRFNWHPMPNDFPVECINDYYNYCLKREHSRYVKSLRHREKTSLGMEY